MSVSYIIRRLYFLGHRLYYGLEKSHLSHLHLYFIFIMLM